MVRRKTHASPQQELRQEHEKVAARKGECEREQDALGILEINLKTARELCDSIRGAERKISSLLAASELSTMTTRRRSLSQGGLSVADRLPAVEPNNVQNRRSRRSTMIAVLPTKNSAAKVVASEKGYRSVSPIKRLNNNTNDLFSYREIEQLEDGSFVESDSNASKSPSPATPIRQRSASTSSSSDVSNLAVQFQNLSIFKRDGDVANEGFLSSNAQRSSGMIPMAQNLSVTSKQNSNRKSTSAAEAPKFMCITKYMSLRTKLVPFVREVTQEELESQGGKNVRWQSPLVHASLSSAGRVPKSSHHGAAFLSANSSLSSLQKSNKSKSAQNSQHSHLFPCQRTSVNDISDEETMNLLKKPKWSRPQATLSGGSEDETGRLRRRSVNVFVHSGSNKARSSSPPPLTRRRLASASSSSSVVSSSQSGLQANKTKRRTTSRGS
uniref:Shugoshin C-terminal domain-containing protein n=1 Tax=Plectus sambesii TaxID=2011161 RepID=A0A914W718_9BILA